MNAAVTDAAGPATAPLRTRHQLVLAAGTFTLGVDGFVLAGLLPQVAGSLRVSVGTAGQLTTLFAVVYAVGSPVIAAVAGGWDRRVLLGIGMAVFGVGMVGQALGPDFAVVAVGRGVAALGAAAYQATAYSLAGTLSDDEHRPRALAVVAGGSSFALVAGLPFGILVGQTWGWRTAMWVLVGSAALSVVLIRTLPSSRAPCLSLRARLAALADRRVLAVLAGTVTALTPIFVVLAYLPAVLVGTGWWVVAATLGYGAGQVAGTAAAPGLVGRFGSRRTLLLGATVVTVGAAALIATRAVDVAAVLTLVVLGSAAGCLVVPQQARLFVVVPRLAPVAIGLNGSSIYLASAIGAGMGGISVSVGAGPGPVVTAAVLGSLAVLVAATVVPEHLGCAHPSHPRPAVPDTHQGGTS